MLAARSSLNYVVSEVDQFYPERDFEKRVAALRLPLLTINWVIQCVLEHRLVRPRPEVTAKRR